MENLNIISVLNLSISAFTGIIVTTYIWKRNNTITKKEKIIKIYFDLMKELEYYSSSYKSNLYVNIHNSIIKSFKDFPEQTGLYLEYQDLFNKVYFSLKENNELKNTKFINKYNPNYFLRLLIVNLSKKEYRLLKNQLTTIQDIIDEMLTLNTENYRDEVSNFHIKVKSIMESYKAKILTYDEIIDQIKDENSFLLIDIYEKNKINNNFKIVDKKIIDFIIKM